MSLLAGPYAPSSFLGKTSFLGGRFTDASFSLVPLWSCTGFFCFTFDIGSVLESSVLCLGARHCGPSGWVFQSVSESAFHGGHCRRRLDRLPFHLSELDMEQRVECSIMGQGIGLSQEVTPPSARRYAAPIAMPIPPRRTPQTTFGAIRLTSFPFSLWEPKPMMPAQLSSTIHSLSERIYLSANCCGCFWSFAVVWISTLRSPF